MHDKNFKFSTCGKRNLKCRHSWLYSFVWFVQKTELTAVIMSRLDQSPLEKGVIGTQIGSDCVSRLEEGTF